MAENTVTISVEEYADLVACRTKVHTACAIIANEHQRDIELMHQTLSCYGILMKMVNIRDGKLKNKGRERI